MESCGVEIIAANCNAVIAGIAELQRCELG